MALLLKLTPEEFRKEFARHVRAIDPSSTSSTKNEPLEALIRDYTDSPLVAVKNGTGRNNLTNRLTSEIHGKSPECKHAILIVPHPLVFRALELARSDVGSGDFDVVGVVDRDTREPVLSHLVYAQRVEDDGLVRAMQATFPTLHSHGVSQAVRAEPPEKPAGGASPGHSRSPDIAAYPQAQCARDLGVSEDTLASWVRRLKRKKQLVFEGPPGTGKTYCAQRLARHLVGGTGGEIETLQFHPSYTYEDFVQGLQANVRNGHVAYAVKKGRFLRFCERAREQLSAGTSFVLIIDELNRGNLSRIFGELLYLLEYRNETIPLAKGKKPFGIPANVHLIATMNTADRSIALVDHAIRRRFSFVFLAPDTDHLSRWLDLHGIDDGGQLVKVITELNRRIGDRHYQLGTSFFLAPGADLPGCLQDIWEGEIEPYLEEYFFQQQGSVEDFRWKTLSTAGLSRWATGDVVKSSASSPGIPSTGTTRP